MSTTALGGVSLTCRSWHRTDSKNRSRNISSSYYRKSLTSKSELIPTHSSRTAAMLVFVVLSVWACPSSTAVEAFVSPAATTSGFATPRGEFRKRSCCTSSTASVDPTTTAVAVGGFRYSRAYSSVLFFSSPRSRSSSKSSTCSDRLRSSNPLLSVTTATLSSTSSVFSAANDNGSPNGGSAGLKEEGETTVERSAKEGKKKQLIRVSTAGEMCRLLSQGESLFDLDARGDSQDMLEAREDEHPVLEVIRKRAKAGTKPGSHGDGLKLGLAIEGGGMRGCVSAGMAGAVLTFGLMDTFDAVYGSSAGSLVGAYAIAGQEGMPRLGCSVYYDTLTGTGRHFIDTRQIFRAMGLGLFGVVVTRWKGLKELFRQRWGSPVLKLDYLLLDVVEKQRPLDWNCFWKKQAIQPLHVIASGVESEKSVVLSSKGGHFKTLRELTECMRASMLLPGITGPMVTLPNVKERLVDSQLYEPIPFKTALDDDCSHVLVFRSRPDGGNLLGKPKLAENLITRRFFKRKSLEPRSHTYMKAGGHKKAYAEAVLTLNEAARAKGGDDGPHLMPICLPASEPEVARLERGRARILEGVRKGYAHAHELLRRAVPEHAMAQMDGWQAALVAFPDSILDEEIDPLVREILERSSEVKADGQSGQTVQDIQTPAVTHP